MIAKRWRAMALAVMLTGLVVSTTVGQSGGGGATEVFLYGTDKYCSPSDANGAYVTTSKVYKDLNTGALTVIAKGQVINECGCFVCFQNLGTTIQDPESYEILVASSSKEIVQRPPRCKCKCSSCTNYATASLVACFQPGPGDYDQDDLDDRPTY